MSILSGPTAITGSTNIKPMIKYMVSTDSAADITTPGYLNANLINPGLVSNSDSLLVRYNFIQETGVGTNAFFNVSINNGVITLTEDITEGNVVLPVTTGDFAVFHGPTGKIYDAGYLPSDPTATNVVMLSNTSLAGHMPTFTDLNGTIDVNVTPATIRNYGDIVAGSVINGVKGRLISCPTDSATGSLILEAIPNQGNNNVTIKNERVGADTTYHIVNSGGANQYIQTSSIPSFGSSNLFWVDISVTVADLNSSGTIIVGSGLTDQFVIRQIFINPEVNFSGGGGDRGIQVTDGTTAYSILTSAFIQAQTNSMWGLTPVPFPVFPVQIAQPTVIGSNIKAVYDGGTTDYTTGSVKLSLLVQKVA